MEKQFKVDILTPQENIYSGQSVSLIVPAQLGYLGVLANHAPLVTKILPGKIIIRESSGHTRSIDIKTQGIMEVFSNMVTLLMDNA